MFQSLFRVGVRCLRAPASQAVFLGAGSAQLVLGGNRSFTKCNSRDFGKSVPGACLTDKGAEVKEDDGLWHEAHFKTRVSASAQQVLSILANIERWHGLIPMCTQSSFLWDHADGFCTRPLGGSKYYKVHFGLAYMGFQVGDTVIYKRTLTECGDKKGTRTLHLVSQNNDRLQYADHLEYTFSTRSTEDRGCEVEVTLKLHARLRMYLVIWKALEGQLLEHIVTSVREHLQDSESHAGFEDNTGTMLVA